jgi:DNA-binding LacI/PurR family transcriptional regulator
MYAFEIGKATARAYIEMMSGAAGMSDQEIIIKPKLFIRASSKRR